MDNFNLLNEKEKLSNFNRKNIENINKLKDFFEKYLTYFNEFLENILILNKNFFESKEKNYDFNNNLNNIIQIFDNSIKNIQETLINLKTNLLKPFENFHNNQLNICKENVKEIENIYYELNNNKCKLDHYKYDYYKMGKNLLKINNNDENSLINNENKEENILKLKSLQENGEIIYKYHLINYNNLIEKYQNSYLNLTNKIKSDEQNENKFIKEMFLIFNNNIKEIVVNLNNFNNNIEKNLNEISIENNNNNNDSFILNNINFEKENFISFEEFIKEGEEKYKIFKEKVLNLKFNYIYNINEQNVLKNLINSIFNEEELNIKLLCELFDIFNKNSNNEQIFIDSLLEKKNNIQILNINNFNYLVNILTFISLNNDSLYLKNFKINLTIIYLSDKIFYINNNNNTKIYICALLSKNRFFRSKFFWTDFIEFKLFKKLEDHLNQMKSIRKKNIISKFFYKNKENSEQNILKNLRIFKLFNNNLDNDDIIFFDKIIPNEMNSIINDSLKDLCNFEVRSEIAFDFLIDLCQKYKIDKKNMNYFFVYYNVQSYTIKKQNFEKNNFSNFNKFKIKIKKNNKNEILLKIINNSLIFLNKQDYFNLFLLNNSFNKYLSKKIFKIILKNPNLNINIRLKIWEEILQIKILKEKYNYQKLKNEIKDEKLKNEIFLDLHRTFFGEIEKNDELFQKISNILIITCTLSDGIKYCQGMNFVVEILYEITKNEEKVFYIFLALFLNTEYSNIFSKNLSKLKSFFYVFQRIINLFLPEISSYLNSNNIEFNFFSSSWFITLFSSSRQFNQNEKVSNVLIRILDNFILFGWKSLLKVCLYLLKFYENKLLKLNNEELLQFLINDVLKNDFFTDKNVDFIESAFEFKGIQNVLIKNIEDEYKLNEKLNENNIKNED